MSWPVLTVAALAALAAAPTPPDGAEKPEAPKETAEDAARRAAEVARLVKQLGHEEWAKREEAFETLRKIGRAAVPALREAAGGKDEEAAARAVELLREILPAEEGAETAAGDGVLRVPGLTNAGRMEINDGGQMNLGGIQILAAKGGKVILDGDRVSYEGNGGTIRVGNVTTIGNEKEEVQIVEETKRLTVKVRPAGENAKTTVYAAPDRAEFKKRYPEIFRKYLDAGEPKGEDAGARPGKAPGPDAPIPAPEAKPAEKPAGSGGAR